MITSSIGSITKSQYSIQPSIARLKNAVNTSFFDGHEDQDFFSPPFPRSSGNIHCLSTRILSYALSFGKISLSQTSSVMRASMAIQTGLHIVQESRECIWLPLSGTEVSCFWEWSDELPELWISAGVVLRGNVTQCIISGCSAINSSGINLEEM